jgi:hypothetical protein
MAENNKVRLVTQGVRGSKVTTHPEHKGFVGVLTSDGPENMISLNAFEGFGETYRRRDETFVIVRDNSKQIFYGSYTEFIECLRFGTEIRNFGKEKKQ